MYLRVETAQPYTLFPTKPMFVNPPAPLSLGYRHTSSSSSSSVSASSSTAAGTAGTVTSSSVVLPYPHHYTSSSQQQQQQQQQQHHNHPYLPHFQQIQQHASMHHFHPNYMYANAAAGGYNPANVKRSSSAFEPLFQSGLPLSPPATPTTSMERMPTLADFAASIVYLMWHARKPSLMATMRSSSSSSASCSPYRHSFSSVSGNASPAFKRFCLQVLTATQLTESAVFLALKYIANLLESNPSIEGAEGSEYRLFIVALMLANKFLDDNTFTNKTWSEVSGMKVEDLNIMEAEFLEALEYNLFVREHEYAKWKSVLDMCREKCAQQHMMMAASMMPDQQQPLQRQEWIASTLHSLGLYSKQADKTLVYDHHHDYVETDDDDDDDDDDEVDDEEELFQMMHKQHNLRHQQQQQEDQHQQQRPMWPTNASRDSNQRQHQMYFMQQEQYRQSITTPPLTSCSSTIAASSQRDRAYSSSQQPIDTIMTTSVRNTSTQPSSSSSSSSYIPSVGGPLPTPSSSTSSTPSHHHHHHQQNHRATSVYRSTAIPPGFQRRSSPWEPLAGSRYASDRCGDSFYSHQPFHPYQRQVTVVPPPSLRASTWCE